jgi:hypothetical protein
MGHAFAAVCECVYCVCMYILDCVPMRIRPARDSHMGHAFGAVCVCVCVCVLMCVMGVCISIHSHYLCMSLYMVYA